MMGKRCGMRGRGMMGNILKGLAGKAHGWLKNSKIISTKLKGMSHPMARVAGHVAGLAGYGKRRRYRRGGALKLAGMGMRHRRGRMTTMRNLPMAY